VVPELQTGCVVHCCGRLVLSAQSRLLQDLFALLVGVAEILEDAGVLLQLDLSVLLELLEDAHLVHVGG
jgi:hypothetical protein